MNEPILNNAVGIVIGALVFTLILIEFVKSKKLKKDNSINEKNNPYKDNFDKYQQVISKFNNLDWISYKESKEKILLDIESGDEWIQRELLNLIKPTPVYKKVLFLNILEESSQKKLEEYNQKKHILNQYYNILKKENFSRTNLYNHEEKLKHDHHYYRTPIYRKTVDMYKKWKDAENNLDSLQNQIRTALSSIDSAQFTETIDLFSKNKGLSVLSSINTSSANDDIRRVKQKLVTLKENLESLKEEQLHFSQSLKEVNDFPDLVIDLVFDFGFDFTSIMSLFNLSDAEDSLKSLRSKTNSIENSIKEQVSKYYAAKNDILIKLE